MGKQNVMAYPWYKLCKTYPNELKLGRVDSKGTRSIHGENDAMLCLTEGKVRLLHAKSVTVGTLPTEISS